MNTTRSLSQVIIVSLALTVAAGGRAQTVADAPPLTPGQERVLAKLKLIVVPEVSFDGLPLNEVMKVVTDDTKKFDPDKQGLNFLFHTAPKAGQSGDDKGYLNTTIIKAWPPLKNLRLFEVLDVITKTADKPIQFTIEDYGISVSRRKLGTPLPEWSTGAQALRAKLEQIVVPEVSFDGLTLNEVIKIISSDAKRFDREKRGVNILLTSFYPDAPPGPGPIPLVLDAAGNPIPAFGPIVLDAKGKPVPLPAAGVVSGPRRDLDTVIVSLIPPVKNVTLAQVLEIVTKTADKPIQYKLEDYGIIFMERFDVAKSPPRTGGK